MRSPAIDIRYCQPVHLELILSLTLTIFAPNLACRQAKKVLSSAAIAAVPPDLIAAMAAMIAAVLTQLSISFLMSAAVFKDTIIVAVFRNHLVSVFQPTHVLIGPTVAYLTHFVLVFGGVVGSVQSINLLDQTNLPLV